MTVDEYEDVRNSIKMYLESFFADKTEELQDKEEMEKSIKTVSEQICTNWSNENFVINDFDFKYVELLEASEPFSNGSDTALEQGTEKDYQSLLKLITNEYKNDCRKFQQ